GHDWALPFYDPLVRLLGGDRARRGLADEADLESKHCVLEIGCGPGTLLLLIKRTHPTVDVTGLGLDPDLKALASSPAQGRRGAGSAAFLSGLWARAGRSLATPGRRPGWRDSREYSEVRLRPIGVARSTRQATASPGGVESDGHGEHR